MIIKLFLFMKVKIRNKLYNNINLKFIKLILSNFFFILCIKLKIFYN